MTTGIEKSGYSLSDGDKVTTVMAYTESTLVLGEVITRESIRVSTWLRTQAIPQFIFFHNASVMRFSGGTTQPQSLDELHLPSSQVIAFHIKPPACDSLDYDPAEPMRKMEPMTALVGWFRFDGFIRMSTQTDLQRYLDVSKEIFTTLYDIDISQPNTPAMGTLHVPYALVRTTSVSFARRRA